jgi:hypothetical protein
LITVLPSKALLFLQRDGGFEERPDIDLMLLEIMPGASPPLQVAKMCKGRIPVVALYSESAPRSALTAYQQYADFCVSFTAAGGVLRSMRAVYAYWLNVMSRLEMRRTTLALDKAA